MGDESNKRKFKWTYLLVGPYLFGLINNEINSRKNFLNKREIIGWIVVILVLAVVMVFDL